jgi:ribosome recycling factor
MHIGYWWESQKGKARRKETTRKAKTWVDNIKMDLREIGRDGMDSIDLAQDRDQWRALVNTVMNLRVP